MYHAVLFCSGKMGQKTTSKVNKELTGPKDGLFLASSKPYKPKKQFKNQGYFKYKIKLIYQIPLNS